MRSEEKKIIWNENDIGSGEFPSLISIISDNFFLLDMHNCLVTGLRHLYALLLLCHMPGHMVLLNCLKKFRRSLMQNGHTDVWLHFSEGAGSVWK